MTLPIAVRPCPASTAAPPDTMPDDRRALRNRCGAVRPGPVRESSQTRGSMTLSARADATACAADGRRRGHFSHLRASASVCMADSVADLLGVGGQVRQDDGDVVGQPDRRRSGSPRYGGSRLGEYRPRSVVPPPTSTDTRPALLVLGQGRIAEASGWRPDRDLGPQRRTHLTMFWAADARRR